MPRALLIVIVLSLLSMTVCACKRGQKPYGGKVEDPTTAPAYTVEPSTK